MRYLPMTLGAGLLLSVGLLAGSGPAHAAMPTLALDRSAVADTAVEKAAYRHHRRYARRSYRRGYYGHGYSYGYQRPIRIWLPPALLWLWLWASLALLREAGTPILIRGLNRSRWRPRPGRFPPPDQPAG